MMRLKKFAGAWLTLSLCATATAWTQTGNDEVEWKEAEVPAPPVFDVAKLVTLDVSPNSTMVYGVDPATIQISLSDSVVRYVMVARSSSGATNVMYEGIRCATGEFKTYARYLPEGRWQMQVNPQWRSLYDNMPSKHPLRFAKAGACDGSAPASSVRDVVSGMKGLR